MTPRWKVPALCATLLAPAVAVAISVTSVSVSLSDPPKAPPDRGFTLRYETPDPADEEHAALLHARRPAERAVEALNAYLDLPERVTVLARSCSGEGSGYDPVTRRIELCYDDLADDLALLGDEAAAADITAETLYHEAGHALIDTLRLPVASDRAEEDAADTFAAFMLIREGPPGERTLLAAAEAYRLAPPPGPGPDEHAPPADRAAAHLCLLHGAAPERHPAPTQGCAPAWPTVRDTWTRDLTPLLRTTPRPGVHGS
ncbi:DUF4344 domain-containing metallopeptidase [Streptomyces sp. W1SF4]|uniref:DUF4344 domain-containing metallopeptidase n=1 Tax=Streptomyces sp. W1SF4 TaxID=2305220 RepID=UPI000F6FCAC1|nr:DUF4344 domain-containing metallopeptidase [Streptomyces sp. W1SF4]AZM90803.1 hypothetical protein D1J60_22025 [Streptomyces sp. W1SF4]